MEIAEKGELNKNGEEVTNGQCTAVHEGKRMAEDEEASKEKRDNNKEVKSTCSSTCIAESDKSEGCDNCSLPNVDNGSWLPFDPSFWAEEPGKEICDINDEGSDMCFNLDADNSSKFESVVELALSKDDGGDSSFLEESSCFSSTTNDDNSTLGANKVDPPGETIKDTGENLAKNDEDGMEQQIVDPPKSTAGESGENLAKNDEDGMEQQIVDLPKSTAGESRENLAKNDEDAMEQQIEAVNEKSNASIERNLKRRREEDKGVEEQERPNFVDLTNEETSSNAQESDATLDTSHSSEALEKLSKNAMKRAKRKLKQKQNKTLRKERERETITKFKELTGCDINVFELNHTNESWKVKRAIRNVLIDQQMAEITEEDAKLFVPYLLEALQRNQELLKTYERERSLLKKEQSAAKKTVFFQNREINIVEAFETVKKDVASTLKYRKSMLNLKSALFDVALLKCKGDDQNVEEFLSPSKKPKLIKRNKAMDTIVNSPGNASRVGSVSPVQSGPRTSPWANSRMGYINASASPKAGSMKPTSLFSNSPAGTSRNNSPRFRGRNPPRKQISPFINPPSTSKQCASPQISPFLNPPSTSEQCASPQQRSATVTNRFLPPSSWEPPPPALTTNLQVSIIDKNTTNGVIPPQKEIFVKESLFAALDKAVSLASYENPKVPTFSSWQYKNGVIRVVCSDEYSLLWLVEKVVEIEPWRGAKLGARVDEEGRNKVTLAITANTTKYEDMQVVLQRLGGQNRRLNIASWNVVTYACKGQPKCHVFEFDIPEEDLQVLKRSGNYVNYGFQTFKVIQNKN